MMPPDDGTVRAYQVLLGFAAATSDTRTADYIMTAVGSYLMGGGCDCDAFRTWWNEVIGRVGGEPPRFSIIIHGPTEPSPTNVGPQPGHEVLQ
jgi:hypothetical protein